MIRFRLLVCCWLSLGALAWSQSFEVGTLETPHDLSGAWLFHPGDDLAWADPNLGDSDWARLNVPESWGRQGVDADWGWFRFRVTLDESVLAELAESAEPLGITLGQVYSAYELYANGEKLGGLGAFPPNEKRYYGKHETFFVPSRLIGSAGTIVFALRVWEGPHRFRDWHGGPYSGPFLFGALTQLNALQFRSRLFPLIILSTFLSIAFYHLYLFVRLKDTYDYLWYGLTTLGVGVFTFFASQWKFDLGLPFVVVKKIEHASLYLLPFFGFYASYAITGIRVNRRARYAMLLFIGFTLAIILIPNLEVHRATLGPWSHLTAFVMLISVGLFMWQARRGNQAARVVTVGATLFTLAALNALLLDQALIQSPALLPFSFFAIIVAMAVLLARRFTGLYKQMGVLVAARTAELEDLHKAHKQLLADIVHDLGTPLTVVSGYLQSLEAGKLEASPERVGILRTELELITTLVEDLRLLSLADAGELRLDVSRVSVNALLSTTVSTFSKLAADRGVRLTSEAEADLQVWADEQRLRRVLTNILGNALRHTPAGGAVRLHAEATGDGVLLEVVDTGEGASEEVVSKLFERFYRADESRGDGAGSGLGLAIAKSIIELHGGHISASSAPGRGMSVRIVLPESQKPNTPA